MQSLQSRILGVWPSLKPRTSAELLQGLRSKLLKASNGGLLRTGSDEIQKWVKLDPPGVPRPEKAPPDAKIIIGAIKDFRRDATSARLIRDDGAWLHFTITAIEVPDRLQIIAYDFELVFPQDMVPPEGSMPRFYRVDLNLPGHGNEERELRSHCHPGNDDLLAPAPVMTPDEILDLLIWGMRPRDADKMRS
jgi:hypothetical protein